MALRVLPKMSVVALAVANACIPPITTAGTHGGVGSSDIPIGVVIVNATIPNTTTMINT